MFTMQATSVCRAVCLCREREGRHHGGDVCVLVDAVEDEPHNDAHNDVHNHLPSPRPAARARPFQHRRRPPAPESVAPPPTSPPNE